ncbi:MAG TPA: SDR family NAD(P)-dependent oxidoreductase, partial [Anaerolineales bacterium]|nr:SDR family NAD(P)-dependent oxidoreductase [Anaerolineales bacterium]
MADQLDFGARYGGWALVAGASEGIGAEYTEQLAARGLNLVLVARRAELLQTLAAEFSTKYNVETKIVPVDLAASDAVERIAENTKDVEI